MYIIIILIIFIFFILDKKNNKQLLNKEKININSKKLQDIKIKKQFNEYGGSKVFKNIKLDNTNLKNNIVNFTNYSSYRIKPYKIK